MISKFQVAYKNLLRKKVRSLLTLIGIALSAWVLVSLLGFNHGFETALNRDIDNMGFQMMLMAKGCPYEAATMMLKGGTGLKYMPESVSEAVMKEPEVERITPMLMQAVFDPNKGENGGIAAYLGVEPESFGAMKSFLKFRQGSGELMPAARRLLDHLVGSRLVAIDAHSARDSEPESVRVRFAADWPGRQAHD